MTEACSDEETVTTRDGRLSAQWEHTIGVTEDGCEILTGGVPRERTEIEALNAGYSDFCILAGTEVEIRGELAGLGIERRREVAEPEDHVAALCEVMGMIISGHGLHLRQSAFFDAYVDSWAGRFFEDLGKAGSADFYRAVAQLGREFLAVERNYFSLPK